MGQIEGQLQAALIDESPVVRALAQMALSRLAAGGKLNESMTSEERISMPAVIATVGNIDPLSVCEDPGCAQRGQLYKDHTVVHKAGGKKKGLRGECPHCHGPLHNTHDQGPLIAFQCLWRQAFGSAAKKTPVDRTSLQTLIGQIDKGVISGWADRTSLLTILGIAAPASAGRATTTASAPMAATSVGTKPTTSPTSPVTTGVAATPPQTASAPARADDPEKKRKLRELLRGAKVQP